MTKRTAVLRHACAGVDRETSLQNGRLLNKPVYVGLHMQDDIVLGKKLATGGFGTVYRGVLNTVDGGQLPIIVKKVRSCLSGKFL